jgi:hypothetical protein
MASATVADPASTQQDTVASSTSHLLRVPVEIRHEISEIVLKEHAKEIRRRNHCYDKDHSRGLEALRYAPLLTASKSILICYRSGTRTVNGRWTYLQDVVFAIVTFTWRE